MGRWDFKEEATTPPQPASGYASLYAKSDKKWYSQDDTGNEVELGAGGVPGAHASSHENGGADELNVGGLNGVLADPQTPASHDSTAHSGTIGTHAQLSSVGADDHHAKNHQATHGPGGADALKLDDLAAPDDNTDLNASTSKHGLMKKLGGGTSNFFRADGDWEKPLLAGLGDANLASLTDWDYLKYDSASGKWINKQGRVPELAFSQQSSNYSPSYANLLTDGPVIVMDTSGGNRTVTLPAASTLPADGRIHRAWIHHTGTGSNTLTVVCNGENFQDGLASLKVLKGKTVQLGGFNAGPGNPGWMRISDMLTTLQVRRAATWASSNFVSPNPIPWDSQDREDNVAVSEWVSGSRIYARFPKVFEVSYVFSIDSSGGLPWVVEAWIRKNGTTDILGSYLRTGNYWDEDQSAGMPPLTVQLEANDYLEVFLDHSNLSGSLVEAMLMMKTRV